VDYNSAADNSGLSSFAQPQTLLPPKSAKSHKIQSKLLNFYGHQRSSVLVLVESTSSSY